MLFLGSILSRFISDIPKATCFWYQSTSPRHTNHPHPQIQYHTGAQTSSRVWSYFATPNLVTLGTQLDAVNTTLWSTASDDKYPWSGLGLHTSSADLSGWQSQCDYSPTYSISQSSSQWRCLVLRYSSSQCPVPGSSNHLTMDVSCILQKRQHPKTNSLMLTSTKSQNTKSIHGQRNFTTVWSQSAAHESNLHPWSFECFHTCSCCSWRQDVNVFPDKWLSIVIKLARTSVQQ